MSGQHKTDSTLKLRQPQKEIQQKMKQFSTVMTTSETIPLQECLLIPPSDQNWSKVQAIVACHQAEKKEKVS